LLKLFSVSDLKITLPGYNQRQKSVCGRILTGVGNTNKIFLSENGRGLIYMKQPLGSDKKFDKLPHLSVYIFKNVTFILSPFLLFFEAETKRQ
jgi:hypothetical protein